VLDERHCQKTIAYIWRPQYARAAAMVPHDAACYHIDDEYSFSDEEQPLDPLESRVIASADQVFIHSPALMAKKGHLNPNTLYVPNGVDYDAFATPFPEPRDLAALPHPRIGYVGRVKPQLDLALVKALVGRHPAWSFVFVGPVENLREQTSLLRELSAAPNVFLLGSKTVGELPAYAQHLDVCMLCYRINEYTKFIYPLKLHEYLASGRPVVGTPIDALQPFVDVVQLARTSDEWSAARMAAMAGESSCPAAVSRRRQIAREHDWDRLVHRIALALAARLGTSYLARLETSEEQRALLSRA
jgi:glycosyltransferase involved in cell wall biosynthesis